MEKKLSPVEQETEKTVTVLEEDCELDMEQLEIVAGGINWVSAPGQRYR